MTILEVEAHEHDGLVHLVLKGELDLSTAEKVEQEIRRAEADKPEVIALDLSRLTFLDSSGLRLIVTADQRARREGRRFAVVRGPDTVQRIFTITNLEGQIEIVDDLSVLSGTAGG